MAGQRGGRFRRLRQLPAAHVVGRPHQRGHRGRDRIGPPGIAAPHSGIRVSFAAERWQVFKVNLRLKQKKKFYEPIL